ncbi:hypothetical protein [Pseudonocardia alni]|uniref:hypothetical protein n=1 Tax=Pseudonocardia alni TaxID=33907 RepID=UPI0027AAC036|nr:hypothetical protein PaSha_01350 [Pseudonocardia alni]
MSEGMICRSPGGAPMRAMLGMADVLLASPDRRIICDRLVEGHRSDPVGRCEHPVHAGRPERHPCPLVRLVQLVDGLAGAGETS